MCKGEGEGKMNGKLTKKRNKEKLVSNTTKDSIT